MGLRQVERGLLGLWRDYFNLKDTTGVLGDVVREVVTKRARGGSHKACCAKPPAACDQRYPGGLDGPPYMDHNGLARY